MKLLIVITLLPMLAGAVTGCADFEQFSPPEPEEEVTEKAPTIIRAADSALQAVYEHLLAQAEGYKAKIYLADFYATCDNWSATSELLKDGTTVWYAEVDMTGIEPWRERPYWQQASWLVFQDGRVIPSLHFAANALRIAADLQELSLPPSIEE